MKESKKPIVVIDIAEHQFKKGLYQAMVQQEVVREYPSTQASNSLSGAIFNDDELGIEAQQFTSVRTAWISVPKDATVAQVQARIDALGEKAVIYRMLSLQPILTDEQRSAIESGITTIQKCAKSQIARFGKGSENEGQPIRWTAKDGKEYPFFRACFFHTNGEKDFDLRAMEYEDMTSLENPITTEQMTEMLAETSEA